MVIQEAKGHAAEMAALRSRLGYLSPSCGVIGGEQGVCLKGFLAQLHQCARRVADGKKPLSGTVELAHRFHLRLQDFWMADSRSAVTCRTPLRWLAGRLLDDEHLFLRECGQRSFALVEKDHSAAFCRDLQILQELAHAPWRVWASLVDICWHGSDEAGYTREELVDNLSNSCQGIRERLVQKLADAKDWRSLTADIAAYAFARDNLDIDPVYRLGRQGEELLKSIGKFAHFPLEWLQGNVARVDVVERNTRRLLNGHPANNVLIWGPRGCGKSSLIRGLIGKYYDRGLRGVEINPDAYDCIPDLFGAVRHREHFYVGVLDNISMSSRDPEVHTLARVLDGCLEAKPDNLVFYATSNYKDLVDRQGERVEGLGSLQMVMSDEQQSLVNQGVRPEFYDPQQRERLDEQRALDDRFALKVFLDLPAKEAYEKMVVFYARHAGIDMEEEELLGAFNVWRMRHNHDLVGGRTARDFALDLAPLENGE